MREAITFTMVYYHKDSNFPPVSHLRFSRLPYTVFTVCFLYVFRFFVCVYGKSKVEGIQLFPSNMEMIPGSAQKAVTRFSSKWEGNATVVYGLSWERFGKYDLWKCGIFVLHNSASALFCTRLIAGVGA